MRRIFELQAAVLLILCQGCSTSPTSAPEVFRTLSSASNIGRSSQSISVNAISARSNSPPAANSDIRRLVSEINDRNVPINAVQATIDALSRSGLVLGGSGTGQPSNAGVGIKGMVLPEEVVVLTRDAQSYAVGQSGVTLADLGTVMQRAGVPFDPSIRPGDHLVRFLALKFDQAARLSNTPQSFVWAFLYASINQRFPQADLMGGTADPNTISVSLLQNQMLLAALLLPLQEGPAGSRFGLAPGLLRLVGTSSTGQLQLAQASSGPADGPCTQMMDRVMRQRAPGTRYESAEVYREAAGVALKEALEELVGSKLEHIGVVTDSLSVMWRIQKLIAFNKKGEVAVTAMETSVHKPLEDQADKAVRFVARAGLRPEEAEALRRRLEANPRSSQFERNLSDCLNVVGPGLYTTAEDLAKEAEKWQVSWEIRPRDTPHVFISLGGSHPTATENVFDFPGQRINRLRRVSSTSAETDLRLTIKPESRQDHETGKLQRATVEVCARLLTAQRPSMGLLVDAGAGGPFGLGTAIVDLLAGWYQTALPPTNCAPLEVTYHQDRPDYRFGPMQINVSETFYGRIPSPYTVRAVIEIFGGRICSERGNTSADRTLMYEYQATSHSYPGGSGRSARVIGFCQINDSGQARPNSCTDLVAGITAPDKITFTARIQEQIGRVSGDLTRTDDCGDYTAWVASKFPGGQFSFLPTPNPPPPSSSGVNLNP